MKDTLIIILIVAIFIACVLAVFGCDEYHVKETARKEFAFKYNCSESYTSLVDTRTSYRVRSKGCEAEVFYDCHYNFDMGYYECTEVILEAEKAP
jgi:hypothetical protein